MTDTVNLRANQLGDDLVELLAPCVAPVNEARILPPVLYTSQEFYEFEREAIFGHDWLCLGRVSQVPKPGDYFPITMVDEPLVVVRGKDGEIRVLSAVCQHRGMVLAEEPGNCNTFTCPYHHWSYGLDGRLLGAPAMERAVGFDKADYRLPSLPVEVWQGFIFTNFDPNAGPLGPSLRRLEALLEHFDLDNSVTIIGDTYEALPWNWKVMLENFNDSYHANRLHGAKQDWAPSENCEFFDDWSDDENHVSRIHHANHIDGSFNPTTKTILPIFSELTEQERWRSLFALVPPSLGLAIVPDLVTYFVVLPHGPGKITIQIGYCVEPAAKKHPLFNELFEQAKAGVNYYNVDDIWVDTMCQRGLSSRFGPKGRLSWQEETLRELNAWTVKRYRTYWPARATSDKPAELQRSK